MTRAEPYGTSATAAHGLRIALFIVCFLAGVSPTYAQWSVSIAQPGVPEPAQPTALSARPLPTHHRAGEIRRDDARQGDEGRDDEGRNDGGRHDEGRDDEGRDDDAEPPREIILSFRYGDVITSDISARYVGRDVFVPVGGLFSLLGIAWHLDHSVPAITGFYVDERRRYMLNFADRTAGLGASTRPILPSEFIVLEHDVFVRPDVLGDVFDFRLLVDMDDLTIYVQSSRMLPVELRRHRARERPLPEDPYAAVRHAPLTHERVRKMLGGGVADYNLSVHRSVHETRLHLQSALGAEILGGDISWQGRTGIAGGAYVAHDYVRWRYAIENSTLLRQIRAGTLHADGLQSRAYRGIHLTNQPARPERFFGEYAVTGQVEPDWELEIYMDDRLVDVTRASASGLYRFHVPLMYGTSRVHVRAYGPAGEVRNVRRRIQVPFSMMSPGEVRYNVNVGEDQDARGLLGQADVGYGLSKHLTARMGMEYMEGLYGERPRVYGSLTSRLLRHFLASIDVVPGGLHRFSLNGLFPSQASVELRFARTDPSSRQLIAGDRSQMSAATYLPFYVGRFPMSLRLSGTRTRYASVDSYRFRTHVQASIRGLQFYVNTESDVSSSYRSTKISPSFSYVWSRPPPALKYFRGLMVSARGRYEVDRRRMDGIELHAAHSISRHTRLQLFANFGMNQRPTSIGFRVSTNLPFARTVTDTRIQSSGASVVQTLRGSVAFDRSNGRILTSSRPAVGRAAAAVRLFVDRNANGTLDADEHVLEHNAVRVDRGSALSSNHRAGVTHVSDLLPYQQYTARIEEGAIANPLWVPEQSAFSFIADPNAVKRIDVPLYAAGVIEGTVVDRRTGEPYRVSGILVRIVNQADGSERVLRTFSDGTFYEMGLHPGTFEVRLDPNQLDAHGLRADSGVHHFVVRATDKGDFVDGIRLAVREKSAEGPAYAEVIPLEPAALVRTAISDLEPPALPDLTTEERAPDAAVAPLEPAALVRTAISDLEPPALTDLTTEERAPDTAGVSREESVPDRPADVARIADGISLPDAPAFDFTPLRTSTSRNGAAPPASLLPVVMPPVPKPAAPEHHRAAPPRPRLAIAAADTLPDDPFTAGPLLLTAPPARVVPMFTWLSFAFLVAIGFGLARRITLS